MLYSPLYFMWAVCFLFATNCTTIQKLIRPVCACWKVWPTLGHHMRKSIEWNAASLSLQPPQLPKTSAIHEGARGEDIEPPSKWLIRELCKGLGGRRPPLGVESNSCPGGDQASASLSPLLINKPVADFTAARVPSARWLVSCCMFG